MTIEMHDLAGADPDGFRYVAHEENDPIAMCYTSGTTGNPKGVVYSHRSTVLHTLVGCGGDLWGLRCADSILPVTPMFHANCWGVPYGCVMAGVKLVFGMGGESAKGAANKNVEYVEVGADQLAVHLSLVGQHRVDLARHQTPVVADDMVVGENGSVRADNDSGTEALLAMRGASGASKEIFKG